MPKDQLQLSEAELAQEVTRMLTSIDPDAVNTISEFNYHKGEYVQRNPGDSVKILFESHSILESKHKSDVDDGGDDAKTVEKVSDESVIADHVEDADSAVGVEEDAKDKAEELRSASDKCSGASEAAAQLGRKVKIEYNIGTIHTTTRSNDRTLNIFAAEPR